MSFNNRNKIDEKICALIKNKEFLKWFKLIYNGDIYYLDANDLQGLVDKIANWYKVEYPDRCFEKKELGHKLTSSDSFMSNLDENEKRIIECPYPSLLAMEMQMESKATNWTTDIKPMSGKYDVIYEIGEEIISLSVDKKGFVDLEDDSGYFNGIIDPKTKPIKIEDFYVLLSNDGKYGALERCISRHYCDITLRNQIFKFVILELLNYSEYGIERAGIALKDLREQFEDLHFDELSEVYAGQKAPKQPHIILVRKPKSL
jgi:hypothetical protein